MHSTKAKILKKYNLTTSVLIQTLQIYLLLPKNTLTKEYHPSTSKSMALSLKNIAQTLVPFTHVSCTDTQTNAHICS